jgi:hypothetical protein
MAPRNLSPVIAINCTVLMLGLAMAVVLPAHGANYPAPIKYRQAMTKIVDETGLRGWPVGHENDGRHIEEIVASPTNNILAFIVKLDIYSDRRLYVRGNGTELVDCTPYLNAAGVDPNKVYGLRMSHDGNRIFFFGTYGTDIYYLIPWSIWEVHPAFKGLAGGDGRLPYTVHYDGSKLFFKHVTSSGGISVPGLYYANVGDPTFTPHLMMPMSKLPGDQNTNLLWYLGSSEYGGSLLCKWYSTISNSQAMWRIPTPSNPPNPSGDPIKVPLEDHNAVWDNSDLNNKIVASQIGAPEGASSALYAYRDSGQLDKLYYVDLISGEKKRLLTADGGGFTFPTLYDNGYFTRVARFSGPYHKATRVNLLTGEQRDTLSYWFGESNTPYYLTDLVDDSSGTFARFYYMGSKPVSQTARIHQVDMTAPPGGNGVAPLISSISFNKQQWAYEDTSPLTVTAQISDPKGRDNLQYVYMQVLVDGLEMPAWLTNGYKPITEAQMFDSGSNGIFTCTSELYKISSFYTHYRLPHEVGVRIIVKNKDANYMIADTTITITTHGAATVPAVLPLLLN